MANLKAKELWSIVNGQIWTAVSLAFSGQTVSHILHKRGVLIKELLMLSHWDSYPEIKRRVWLLIYCGFEWPVLLPSSFIR